MKRLLLLTLLLAGCASEPEPTISREQAEQEVQELLPGYSLDGAGVLIDHICEQYNKGWGPGLIINKDHIPPEDQEVYSEVMLLAAQSTCPNGIEQMERWLQKNFWWVDRTGPGA